MSAGNGFDSSVEDFINRNQIFLEKKLNVLIIGRIWGGKEVKFFEIFSKT